MAEEPQPAGVHEGAEQPLAPASAEDRKAQAAMSTLDAAQREDDGAPKKNVDTEALGKAMKNLDVKDQNKKQEVKKVVKVDPADVTLLVGQPQIRSSLGSIPRMVLIPRFLPGRSIGAFKTQGDRALEGSRW